MGREFYRIFIAANGKDLEGGLFLRVGFCPKQGAASIAQPS
jgi:hypothetical protein